VFFIYFGLNTLLRVGKQNQCSIFATQHQLNMTNSAVSSTMRTNIQNIAGALLVAHTTRQ